MFVIPHVFECKYLGIIVCQKNCDRDREKMYANSNTLLRRFSKCSIPVKCYLFKSIAQIYIVLHYGIVSLLLQT